MISSFVTFVSFFCFRYNDINNIVYKKLGSTVKAYENWEECKTLERLESIKNNPNAIHMESLAIRERILGGYTFYTFIGIIYYLCILIFSS